MLYFSRIFEENLTFPKKKLFHCEVFDLTKYGLDIDDIGDIGACTVNVKIAIRKSSSNLFRISFDELLKGTTVLITNIS